jgi:hypothetical protein
MNQNFEVGFVKTAGKIRIKKLLNLGKGQTPKPSNIVKPSWSPLAGEKHAPVGPGKVEPKQIEHGYNFSGNKAPAPKPAGVDAPSKSISDHWNGLSTGQKVGVGAAGGVAGAWGIHKAFKD